MKGHLWLPSCRLVPQASSSLYLYTYLKLLEEFHLKTTGSTGVLEILVVTARILAWNLNTEKQHSSSFPVVGTSLVVCKSS